MGFSICIGVIYVSLQLPLLQIMVDSQLGVLAASKYFLAVIARGLVPEGWLCLCLISFFV